MLMSRTLRALFVAAPLALATAQAGAAVPDQARDAITAMQRLADRFLDRAEQAITIGGIIIERNRHMIAGGSIGCGVGAAIGATSVAAAGVATSGAAFAGAPDAVALGCLIGAAGGAAIGLPLDHPGEP